MTQQTNRGEKQREAAEQARGKNRIKDLVRGVKDLFQGQPGEPARKRAGGGAVKGGGQRGSRHAFPPAGGPPSLKSSRATR